MNTINIADLKVGMRFRNIYGEHYSKIAFVNAEGGTVKSEDVWYGYTGQPHYWFALDRIQVQNDAGVWCYIDERKKDAEA